MGKVYEIEFPKAPPKTGIKRFAIEGMRGHRLALAQFAGQAVSVEVMPRKEAEKMVKRGVK